MDEYKDIPKGVVLFSNNCSTSRKFKRLLFTFISLIATLALIWPIYPFFSNTFPLILGLPLSLFWVISWLFIVLIILVWLFNSGDKNIGD